MADENTTTHEDRVRARAYQLWEEAGRPDGRSAEFWHRARAEVDEEMKSEGTQPQTAGETLGTQTPGLAGRAARSSS